MKIMRTWVVPLGVVLLTACGAVAQNPTATPTTASSPSPPGSPTPHLTAFAGPCRLAVSWGGDVGGAAVGGGFITFPGATFAADPTAHGGGAYGWLTDSSKSRLWLPMEAQFTSPDGRTWLYFTLANGILIEAVDVATGQHTTLDYGQKDWHPIGLDDTAAYAIAGDGNSVWRFPLTGAPRTQVSSGGGYWTVISAGAAWGFAGQSVPAGAPTVLRRLDLATGSTKDFASVSVPVSIVGLDGAGLPVLASTQGGMIFTVSASGTTTQIASGFTFAGPLQTPSPPAPFNVVGDVNGLWLGGADGVYVYQNGAMGKVSTVIATPAGTCA